jgi:hypothetical protein
MRNALLAALPLAAFATSASADCKEDVLSVMDRSTLAGPYRTEAALIAGERRATMASEVVPPGDMRMKTTTDGRTREILKIGDQVWTNDGEGWKIASPAIAARVAQMAQAAMKTIAPNFVNDVDCQGKKTVEGRDFLVYGYKIDLPGGKAGSTNTLYVDPDSRLPARVVVEGRAGAMKSRTEIRYTYDSSIKLEAPKPAGE